MGAEISLQLFFGKTKPKKCKQKKCWFILSVRMLFTIYFGKR